MAPNKKGHHYVPKAYLNAFCDDSGRLLVYRKDAPGTALRQSPETIAFRKYYYTQPKPEGGRDNDQLENAFSGLENQWPGIVRSLSQQQDVNHRLEAIFQFIGLQRVRVPASRDAMEFMLAERVKAGMRMLELTGGIPPPPAGFEDILDHIEVSIDPHQSIHGMVRALAALGAVFDRIGIGALHNESDLPFLTSDNPVAWFDPTVAENELCPYVISADGPVALVFPVTPRLLIYGHTSMHAGFVRTGLAHQSIADVAKVFEMNRRICRFAYQAVFAQRVGQEDLIAAYAHESPVVSARTVATPSGELEQFSSVFGPRRPKPKWKG